LAFVPKLYKELWQIAKLLIKDKNFYFNEL